MVFTGEGSFARRALSLNLAMAHSLGLGLCCNLDSDLDVWKHDFLAATIQYSVLDSHRSSLTIYPSFLLSLIIADTEEIV